MSFMDPIVQGMGLLFRPQIPIKVVYKKADLQYLYL